MRCDKRVVISSEKEKVAVLQIDVGLFDVDGQGDVDEGVVAYEHVVLEIEGPERRHVGIGVVFGEILYGDHGLKGCSLLEDRL